MKTYCQVDIKTHKDRACPDCGHDVVAHMPAGGNIFICAACDLSDEMMDEINRRFPEATE